MSSWFSYLLGTVPERDEEAETAEPQPEVEHREEESTHELEGLAGLSPSTSNNIGAALEGLSEQQRELISDVLRRAEASRRGAKVVVDGRRLQRYSRMQRGSSSERQFSVEEIPEIPQDDSIERGDLVQMDSIPEDLTVSMDPQAVSTRGRSSFSWISNSESDWAQSTLRSRIETFGKRLSHWFDTLDYDGDYMNLQFNIGSNEVTSLNKEISSFSDVLSTGVIILALFELYESSLQSSFTLHTYCEKLTGTILAMIYSDLKHYIVSNDEIVVIDAYCSQMVLHIMDEILQATRDKSALGLLLPDELKETIPKSLSVSQLSTPLSACYEVLTADTESSETEDMAEVPWYKSWQPPTEPLSDLEGIRTSIEQRTALGRESNEVLEPLPPQLSPVESDEYLAEKPEDKRSFASEVTKGESKFDNDSCTYEQDEDIALEKLPFQEKFQEEMYWRSQYSGHLEGRSARTGFGLLRAPGPLRMGRNSEKGPCPRKFA
ncbi:unnamed protein product [Cylicocyclus nassatus]|uniref:Uncharacterized protein n=1 Tax=Cylicocyclus nassatus TaxID=53992 RepID=A0AA36H3B2_CYLNA|nr:unnamed protein product [Cylicocyclus nassatus]